MGGAVLDDFIGRFERTLKIVQSRWGSRGLDEVSAGLAAASALSVASRRNLGEQLRWLCNMDAYREMAIKLIDASTPSGRTSIEKRSSSRAKCAPRLTCTTITGWSRSSRATWCSGRNLGMKLRLAPGEMVLVPEGRLHGSSIESPVCTYHQPIIPEEWVRPLVEELDRNGTRKSP